MCLYQTAVRNRDLKAERQERLMVGPGNVHHCLQLPHHKQPCSWGNLCPWLPFSSSNAIFFPLGKAPNEECRQGNWVTQRKGEVGTDDRGGRECWQESCLQSQCGGMFLHKILPEQTNIYFLLRTFSPIDGGFIGALCHVISIC